jgi:hypothetical protein
MKLNSLKKIAFAGLMSAAFAAPALADGFSATLETPIGLSPTSFSVAGSLNYSMEVIPQLFVGGSLGGGYNITGNTGTVGARVGGVYVLQLAQASNAFVNAYVGAGANGVFIPGPNTFGFAVDVNGGLFARYALSPQVRAYGGVDAEAGYNFSSGFAPAVSGYAGLRFEPLTALSVYAQGGLGYGSIKAANASGSSLTVLPVTNPGLVYDLRAGLFYQFAPQFQMGFYGSYNQSNAFTIGLTAKFLEKPNTLGIAGNYLP